VGTQRVRAERARWATARGARDQRWIRTRYLKYLGTKCSVRCVSSVCFIYCNTPENELTVGTGSPPSLSNHVRVLRFRNSGVRRFSSTHALIYAATALRLYFKALSFSLALGCARELS
jgi:hypothetical protein